MGNCVPQFCSHVCLPLPHLPGAPAQVELPMVSSPVHYTHSLLCVSTQIAKHPEARIPFFNPPGSSQVLSVSYLRLKKKKQTIPPPSFHSICVAHSLITSDKTHRGVSERTLPKERNATCIEVKLSAVNRCNPVGPGWGARLPGRENHHPSLQKTGGASGA